MRFVSNSFCFWRRPCNHIDILVKVYIANLNVLFYFVFLLIHSREKLSELRIELLLDIAQVSSSLVILVDLSHLGVV